MDVLEKFRLYLVRQGNKPSSVVETIKLINRLRVENPSFGKEGFEAFVLLLKDQGKINSYINHFIIAIRHWGKCFDLPELASFPRVKGNNSTFIKATMSDEEIEAFLTLPYFGKLGGAFKDRFNMWTVFFSILAYSGARPSEVAHLHINDVDFGRNMFLFNGKTGMRVVPISFVIRNKVTTYIKSLKGDKLFPPWVKKDGYMDGSDWRYPFYERLKRLGIKRKNLTVYSLRHSFITRQADEDVSLFKIQQLVGHKQLDTTARYVHLGEKALQKAIENDRLANIHRSATEIIRDFIDKITEFEKSHIDKVLINVNKSMRGDEVTIVIKAKK